MKKTSDYISLKCPSCGYIIPPINSDGVHDVVCPNCKNIVIEKEIVQKHILLENKRDTGKSHKKKLKKEYLYSLLTLVLATQFMSIFFNIDFTIILIIDICFLAIILFYIQQQIKSQRITVDEAIIKHRERIEEIQEEEPYWIIKFWAFYLSQWGIAFFLIIFITSLILKIFIANIIVQTVTIVTLMVGMIGVIPLLVVGADNTLYVAALKTYQDNQKYRIRKEIKRKIVREARKKEMRNTFNGIMIKIVKSSPLLCGVLLGYYLQNTWLLFICLWPFLAIGVLGIIRAAFIVERLFSEGNLKLITVFFGTLAIGLLFISQRHMYKDFCCFGLIILVLPTILFMMFLLVRLFYWMIFIPSFFAGAFVFILIRLVVPGDAGCVIGLIIGFVILIIVFNLLLVIERGLIVFNVTLITGKIAYITSIFLTIELNLNKIVSLLFDFKAQASILVIVSSIITGILALLFDFGDVYGDRRLFK